jgi:hypothetical protein
MMGDLSFLQGYLAEMKLTIQDCYRSDSGEPTDITEAEEQQNDNSKNSGENIHHSSYNTTTVQVLVNRYTS